MGRRQARKLAEGIYTKRAREGFPPVSKLILHRDGSITERDAQSLARRATIQAFISTPAEEHVEVLVDAAKQYEARRSRLQRAKEFFRRLLSMGVN